MILAVVWVMVALAVGLYVLFIVWRLRVERRKSATPVHDPDSTLSSTLARAATMAPPGPTDAAPAAPVAGDTPSASATTTIADALRGIELPNGLAPLTTMAPRAGTADRVAFWTDVPAEIVGPAFGDELERLGYTITSLDEHTLAAQRANDRLVAIIHPDGRHATIGEAPAFESVPELATVIEVWIPL